MREEEPDPRTWDQTQRDLKQLERIADYVHQHWPGMDDQQVDEAVIQLLQRKVSEVVKWSAEAVVRGDKAQMAGKEAEALRAALDQADKENDKLRRQVLVLGQDVEEAADRANNARRDLEAERAKVERLERHIVKLTGHPDGPMSAHRPETPGGGKPAPGDVAFQPTGLDPKGLDPKYLEDAKYMAPPGVVGKIGEFSVTTWLEPVAGHLKVIREGAQRLKDGQPIPPFQREYLASMGEVVVHLAGLAKDAYWAEGPKPGAPKQPLDLEQAAVAQVKRFRSILNRDEAGAQAAFGDLTAQLAEAQASLGSGRDLNPQKIKATQAALQQVLDAIERAKGK